MIKRKGLTFTLELRNYMKTSHPGEHISKPGYLKQLMKLCQNIRKTKELLSISIMRAVVLLRCLLS